MKFVLRNGNINDINTIAAAHVKCYWDAFQDILPQPLLEDFTLQKALKQWRAEFVEQVADADRAIFVIENESGRVVGFANCGATKARSRKSMGQGEIYSLFIESDYQGYGLGKALMLASSRWLISRGLFTGGVWIIEENGIGRRFCEDLGARMVARRKTNHNGYNLSMIGFAWADFTEVAQLETEVPNWMGN